MYLVRKPERRAQREASAEVLNQLSCVSLNRMPEAEAFATACIDLARKDDPTELGALKVFKIRNGGAPAEERLKREIAILREGRPNLPRLLDAMTKSNGW